MMINNFVPYNKTKQTSHSCIKNLLIYRIFIKPWMWSAGVVYSGIVLERCATWSSEGGRNQMKKAFQLL